MSDPDDRIRLALNHWYGGQILQPEHFRAEAQALLGHDAQTARLAGLPFYGVAELAWNEALLAKGTVSFQSLTVVFPEGELAKIQSNATIADYPIPAPGAEVTLYLHLSNQTDHETRLDLYNDDKPGVTRVLYELSVSTDSSIQDFREPMKLAVLTKGGAGYQLSPAYVPPLLRVGTSPFLTGLFTELAAALEQAQLDLREEIDDSAETPDEAAARRRLQIAVYRVRTLLADLDKQVHLHPYHVLSALRDLYLEACLFQDQEPAPFAPETYDHDDLATAFNALVRSIEALLEDRPSVSGERLTFKQSPGDNRFIAGPFPSTLLAARTVYLLVPRPSTYQSVSLGGVKLASPDRLELVVKRALRGVRFTPVTDPPDPPPSTFGTDLDVYRIVPNTPDEDDDWAKAKKAAALAYYDTPKLRNLTLALAWSAT